jgi:hypothetical protein
MNNEAAPNRPRNRIAVFYGGTEYAISDRTLEEVVRDVEAGVSSDGPAWLAANIGQGRSTPVQLLLGRGIPIAVGQINTDGDPVTGSMAVPKEGGNPSVEAESPPHDPL